MASLIKGKRTRDKRVTYCVQLTLPSGQRPKINFGSVSKTYAMTARLHIEHLEVAKKTGCSVPEETVEWLARLGSKVHQRLEKIGLVTAKRVAERKKVWTVGECADRYIASVKGQIKPTTRSKLEQGKKWLVKGFGNEQPIDSLTVGQAKDWRNKLKGGLAEATVATHVKCAKQFFGHAVDHEVITSSPFANVEPGRQTNDRRKFFVERKEFYQAIEYCPDVQWRLILALPRLAGLRVPSEIGALKWEHVDWVNARITVPVPKLEHREGRESRQIPLFKDLRPFLEAAREAADVDAVWVVPQASKQNAKTNLRTQLLRILKAAGIKPWPRIFQNLRASCETELIREYSLHEVCSWIGNSPNVAVRHYLVVTDDAFARAAGQGSDEAGKSSSP